MRILFDLGHPADVHLFKHAIWHSQKSGYRVQIVCRPRDNLIALLERYHFPYVSLGHAESLTGKMLNMFRIDYALYRFTRRFRPHLMVSFASPYTVHVSYLLKIPTITFIDTEPDSFSPYYFYYRVVFQPFVKKVFIPESYQQKFNAPHRIRYRGFKELAYLHPNRFQVNPGILAPLRLKSGEKIIVVKFAAADAIHDVRYRMFEDNRARVRFVRSLQQFGRVFVSSEVPIPELKELEIPLQPGDIHHLLAVATLYVGEGATMAAEAGILGTPWVFLYERRLGYLDFQEKRYGLGKICFNAEDALNASKAFLSIPEVKAKWAQRRARLLKDHIDVSELIIQEIEKVARNSELSR